MKSTPFSKELKKWRGARGQKVAAELIDANLRTYEGWEIGRSKPSRYAINEIRRRMAANPETKNEPATNA